MTNPVDVPEDFDELMDRLPWSLRTRLLRALSGDTENEDDERPLTEDEIRARLPQPEPWVDPTIDEILEKLDKLG